MRKFSLFTFVICVPLIAAILCGAYSARTASNRRQAEIVFHQSMDNQINTKYSTGVAELVAAHGHEQAAEIVAAKAEADDMIAFDGVGRLAKSISQAMEYSGFPPTDGYSDGFVLKSFDHENGATWIVGPAGARISRIRFTDDKLIVSIYGNLKFGASTRIVPKGQPEDYVVPWPKGTAPMNGSLYDAVKAQRITQR